MQIVARIIAIRRLATKYYNLDAVFSQKYLTVAFGYVTIDTCRMEWVKVARAHPHSETGERR